MYVYELVTRDHRDFGRNHQSDLWDLSLVDPLKAEVIFIGNVRKDWVDPSSPIWEDVTVYDVYIAPNDSDPDETVLLFQFSGGDGCQIGQSVRTAKAIIDQTQGSNERAMLYAYGLRLLQHHRQRSNIRPRERLERH